MNIYDYIEWKWLAKNDNDDDEKKIIFLNFYFIWNEQIGIFFSFIFVIYWQTCSRSTVQVSFLMPLSWNGESLSHSCPTYRKAKIVLLFSSTLCDCESIISSFKWYFFLCICMRRKKKHRKISNIPIITTRRRQQQQFLCLATYLEWKK